MNPSSEKQDTLLKYVAANCACYQVRRASRLITQHYDQAFAPLGLRATQFTLLVGIALYGPITVKQLAEGLAIDRTTLTRNLKRLVASGHIAMVPGKDRRERLADLTSAGKACLAKALPLWQQVQADVMTQFPASDGAEACANSEWASIKSGLAKLANLDDNREG